MVYTIQYMMNSIQYIICNTEYLLCDIYIHIDKNLYSKS